MKNTFNLLQKVILCIRERRLPTKLTLLMETLNPLPMFYLLQYDFKLKFKSRGKNKQKKMSDNAKIYPVYFSCKTHFDFLFLSLISLQKLNCIDIDKAYLYIDNNDFLSKEQINQLKSELSVDLVIRKTKYPMSWGGANVIINELNAFKEISREINDNDYIVKTDSDILFISKKIFQEVKNSDYFLIGRISTTSLKLNFLHISGGCYFLKAAILPKVLNCSLFKIVKKATKMWGFRTIGRCPEDAVMFNLVIKQTKNIKLVPCRYDYFIDYAMLQNNISEADIENGSVMHFIHNKDKMHEWATKLNIIKT